METPYARRVLMKTPAAAYARIADDQMGISELPQGSGRKI